MKEKQPWQESSSCTWAEGFLALMSFLPLFNGFSSQRKGYSEGRDGGHSVEEFEHFTDFSLNTSTKPIQSREPWMRPLTAALGTDGTGDQPCSGCCSTPAHPSPRRLKDNDHILQREKEARMPFWNMKYGHIWSINKTRDSYRYMNIHVSYETPIW